jgi:hypothetical protein
MKTQNLQLYPMLEKDATSRVGLMILGFKFGCSEPNVDPEPNGASWPGPVTFGQQGIWNPADYDLSVEITMLFNPSTLFGADGIACTNAVLGAVLEWTSLESSQRGHSNLVEFSHDACKVKAAFALQFDRNQVRGNVILSVNFYVIVPDRTPALAEMHLANRSGLYLGSVGGICPLVFDGDGALFPVIEYAGKPDDALWRIKYESTDPCEDIFAADMVCLEINNRHPDYPAYKGDDGHKGGTPLERQIVASWLTMFLLILKEKNPDVYECLKNDTYIRYSTGSIAHFANYLLSSFQINRENIQNLSATLNKVVAVTFLDGASTL